MSGLFIRTINIHSHQVERHRFVEKCHVAVVGSFLTSFCLAVGVVLNV
jgi:hypothetical protein